MYLDSTRCIPCSQLFDDNRKPCRGSCSHTICVPCKEKLKEFQCPICDQVGAFKDVNPDYTALEIAKQLQETLKIGDLWAFTPTEQDVTVGPCSECSTHTRKLRLCTDCAEKDGLIRRFEETWILISEHADYQREFIKIKSTALCADCVLEGAHEGHRIEVFREALKDNFETKEQTEEMLKLKETAFAGLMKPLKMLLLAVEMKKDWPINQCVLEDNTRSPIPKQQAEIEKVRRTMRYEALRTKKVEERVDMLQLELQDLMLQDFKRNGLLTASEIQELEAIRAKFPNPKYLTEWDVREIDERLFEKMAQAGSVEALEVARRAEQKVFDEKKEKMLKLQLKDDEAGSKYARYVSAHQGRTRNIREFNGVLCEYLVTSINLTRAHIQCERAFQDVHLNSMMSSFMHVIAMKLRQLPIFRQMPFKAPSPYLNDFLPSNLRK